MQFVHLSLDRFICDLAPYEGALRLTMFFAPDMNRYLKRLTHPTLCYLPLLIGTIDESNLRVQHNR